MTATTEPGAPPAAAGRQQQLREIGVLTERLADLLEVENQALRTRAFAAAAELVGDKTALIQALTAARAALEPLAEAAELPVDLPAAVVEAMLRSADRLRQLSAENHALLAEAVSLQTELLAVIAGAVPRALAAEAPSYGATGTPDLPRRADAFAFLAKA